MSQTLWTIRVTPTPSVLAYDWEREQIKGACISVALEFPAGPDECLTTHQRGVLMRQAASAVQAAYGHRCPLGGFTMSEPHPVQLRVPMERLAE